MITAKHYRGIYASKNGIVIVKGCGQDTYIVTDYGTGIETRRDRADVEKLRLDLVDPIVATRLHFNREYDYLSALWTHSNLREAIKANMKAIEMIFGVEVAAHEVKLEAVQHCYGQVGECCVTLAAPFYSEADDCEREKEVTLVMQIGKALVFGSVDYARLSIRKHANAIVAKKVLELGVEIKTKQTELKKLRSTKF